MSFWWIIEEYQKIMKRRDPFYKIIKKLDNPDLEFEGLRELKINTEKKGDEYKDLSFCQNIFPKLLKFLDSKDIDVVIFSLSNIQFILTSDKENFGIAREKRHHFQKIGGLRILLEKYTSTTEKKLIEKYLEVLVVATTNMLIERLYPSDIPFGSTGGMEILYLPKDTLRKFLEPLDKFDNSKVFNSTIKILHQSLEIPRVAKYMSVIETKNSTFFQDLATLLTKRGAHQTLVLGILSNILYYDFSNHLDVFNDESFLELALKTGETSKIVRILSTLFTHLYSKGESEYKKRNLLMKMMLNDSNKALTFSVMENLISPYILTKKLANTWIDILLEDDCLENSLNKIIKNQRDSIFERERLKREKIEQENQEKLLKLQEQKQMENFKEMFNTQGNRDF